MPARLPFPRSESEPERTVPPVEPSEPRITSGVHRIGERWRECPNRIVDHAQCDLHGFGARIVQVDLDAVARPDLDAIGVDHNGCRCGRAGRVDFQARDFHQSALECAGTKRLVGGIEDDRLDRHAGNPAAIDRQRNPCQLGIGINGPVLENPGMFDADEHPGLRERLPQVQIDGRAEGRMRVERREAGRAFGIRRRSRALEPGVAIDQ